MTDYFPEKPVLIRTLSEQHWICALFEMMQNNLKYIKAGHHGKWNFFLKKDDSENENRINKYTVENNRVVKIEKMC